MKTTPRIIIILSLVTVLISEVGHCQGKSKVEDYLKNLPKQLKLVENTPQKYLMTAEYFNKNIYGDLLNKVKVTGEYTRGLDSGYVCWNNVFISHTYNPSEVYQENKKQDYMENLKYIPTPRTLQESFFNNFPKDIDNVYSRNLIWDAFTIETYAWDYFDSLQLNKTYVINNIHGSFDLAEMGKYNHSKIELNWIGISLYNNQLCAVIEYRALDNKIELNTNDMKSKGSELYWGKTWISLKNKQIEHAEMYSNTIQELDIKGLTDKMTVCTKRILEFDKIK